MSDDEGIDDLHNANEGVTLPEGVGAIYNAGLTPLFTNRVGHIDINIQLNRFIGSGGYLYAASSYTEPTSYYLAISSRVPNIWPSYVNQRTLAFPLRCLVSTNNRLMNKEEISLVSDVVTADGETNMGISLPMATNATHNSALSPFFLNRSGMLQDILIVSRGTEYNSWSVSSYDPTFAGRFVAGGNVRPSYALYRRYGMSLRCLVSTNNR